MYNIKKYMYIFASKKECMLVRVLSMDRLFGSGELNIEKSVSVGVSASAVRGPGSVWAVV